MTFGAEKHGEMTLGAERFPLSGEGVKFDPLQVLGSYAWPTVGAYERTHHLGDNASLYKETPLAAKRCV